MVGSMIRLIIFIVVVLPQPGRPDQHGQLAGGEGQVELGHAHRAVGVDLADPLEPDLLGAVLGPAARLAGWADCAVASTGWPSWERPLVSAVPPRRCGARGRRGAEPLVRPVATWWTTGTPFCGYLGEHVRLTVAPSCSAR